MKFLLKWFIILLLLLLGSLIIGSCQTSNQQVNKTETPSIIQVDDFAADRRAYSGDIVLKGIVASVDPLESSFVIIDTREYELCQDLTCAANYITIKTPTNVFSGVLPEIEDEVFVYITVGSENSYELMDIQMVERGRETILRRD